MPTFQISINNKALEHQGQEDDRLLTVLHDQGLTASKLGCGSGHCGACTVWVAGVPARACELTMESLCAVGQVGKDLTTLEGLAERKPRLAECLLEAFSQEQAAQCGYCSAGILMKAAALIKDQSIDQGRSPLTEAQVAQALDDHLCRCGSQGRVMRAVLLASKKYSAKKGPC
jgi:nicotinate dehydrogenase subunit A